MIWPNGFSLLAFCEDGCYNNVQFPVVKGSLSPDRILQAADDPKKATFFLSGPAAMINSFKTGLSGKGVNPEKIRIDEWE